MAAILFAVVFLIAMHLMGFDIAAVVRDRGLSDEPGSGLLSDIGILWMGLSGLFTLWQGARTQSRPLFLLGIFCCLFALDDGLLLHEKLHQYEVFAFAFYLVFLVYIFRAFSAAVGVVIVWPVLVTLFAFGCSVMIDVLWGSSLEFMRLSPEITAQLAWFGYVLEDVPKFAGIVVLAGFALGEARRGQCSVRSGPA